MAVIAKCALSRNNGVYCVDVEWTSLEINEHHMESRDITGHHRTTLDITRYHRTSPGIHGHHRTSSDITRYHRASQGITGHHRTTSDSTRYQRAAWGITEHHEPMLIRLNTNSTASTGGISVMFGGGITDTLQTYRVLIALGCTSSLGDVVV